MAHKIIFKPEYKRLVFKHESEEDGMIIGPLWWQTAKKVKRSWGIFNETVPVINGSKKPDGGYHAAWVTLREARKMAKHFHLELEEV